MPVGRFLRELSDPALYGGLPKAIMCSLPSSNIRSHAECIHFEPVKASSGHDGSPRGLWRGIRNAGVLAIPAWLLLLWVLGFLAR